MLLMFFPADISVPERRNRSADLPLVYAEPGHYRPDRIGYLHERAEDMLQRNDIASRLFCDADRFFKDAYDFFREWMILLRCMRDVPHAVTDGLAEGSLVNFHLLQEVEHHVPPVLNDGYHQDLWLHLRIVAGISQVMRLRYGGFRAVGKS